MRRRLNARVALDAAVAPAWLAATAFALWRLLVQRGVLVVGALALVVTLVLALRRARRGALSPAAAAVITDGLAGAKGLLLTRLERPVGEWELGLNQRLVAVKTPPLQLGRPLALLGLCAAFVAASLWVTPPKRPAPTPNAAAETRLAALEEKVAAIAREAPVSDVARDTLEQLAADMADGRFDETAWEAADGLDARLDDEAAEASAKLARAEEAARALEDALADAQGDEAAAREREALERALLELSDDAASDDGAGAADPNEGAQGSQAKGGDGEGKQAEGKQAEARGDGEGKQGEGKQGEGKEAKQGGGAGSKPSSAAAGGRREVADLREALRRRREALDRPFQPGAQSGSGARAEAGGRQRGAGAGQRGGVGAGQRGGAARRGGGAQGHASRGVPEGSAAGPGGGSEALVFGDAAEMDPDRLGFEALPEGHGGEAGALYGLRASNPALAPGAPLGGPGGQVVSGEAGAGYQRAALRPRNRALVERYFDTQ